jgi:hypothetical protein
MRIGRNPWAASSLAILLAGVFGPSASAQNDPVTTVQTVKDATEGIAQGLATALKDNGEKEVVLGAIDGPGPENRVALPLADALKKHEITTVDQAAGASRWRITGDVFTQSLKDKSTHVTIECRLKPPDGPVRTYVKYAVANASEVASLLGTTGALPTQSEPARQEGLKESVKNPTFDAQPPPPPGAGPQVAEGKPDELSLVTVGPYKVLILRQPGGKGPYLPAPLVLPKGDVKEGANKGQPIIDLQPGDNYAIRVINGSELPAGVEILIDGINMFAVSPVPEWKALGKSYFKPGQDFAIQTWPDALKSKFKVVNELDSVHRKFGLRERGSLGVITVSFCAAWDFGEKPPADEGVVFKDIPSTGFGEPDPAARGFKSADSPKIFGAPRAQISIRYSKPRPDQPPLDLPGKEPLSQEGPARQAPAKEAPANEAPVKVALAKEAPAKEAPPKAASPKAASPKEASPKEASPKEASPKEASPAREAPPGTFDEAIPDTLSANLRKGLKAQPATFDEPIQD